MATGLDQEGSTRGLLTGLAVRLVIGFGVTWFLYYTQGPFGLVFAAPVWGFLLAKPILDLIPAFISALRRSAYTDWEGEVHTFEAHPLRVRDVGGYVWIVDGDLLAVLEEKPSDTQRRRADAAFHAPIPDSALWGWSEPGAIKLLAASRHPDANKLRLFLERQVFLPARKRRERARIGACPGSPKPAPNARTFLTLVYPLTLAALIYNLFVIQSSGYGR